MRVAVAGHGLVDGVVDDLVDQVVQPADTGGADVHAGALADGFEPLEDRDRTGVVGVGGRGQGVAFQASRDERSGEVSHGCNRPRNRRNRRSGA